MTLAVAVTASAAVFAAAVTCQLCLAWGAARLGCMRRLIVKRESRRGSARCPVETLTPKYRAEFEQLTSLVEQVEAKPARACSLDLRELLAAFLRTAVVHGACERAIGMVNRRELAGALRRLRRQREDASALSSHRRDYAAIVRSRLEHWDECAKRAALLAARLDAMGELIRFAAQRAQVEAVEPAFSPRLADLLAHMTDTDQAMRELSE